MRGRCSSLLLALLAACAPEHAFDTTTTTAVVIHRAPPRPTQPKREPAPTRIVRPAHEAPKGRAAAVVVGAEMALPMLAVLPRTPTSATLSRVLPPVEPSGELPGTLQVIGALRGLGAIVPPTSAAVGPGVAAPQRFWSWWLFPFFPFGLSKAGGPPR